MWLLSTDRAELHYFPSPDAVTGGYAILSHTWGDNEQTFQEMQDLEKECGETHKNPRDLCHDKVRECCMLAERHGYRWVWDDTCCIDKASSTETSEAINSMFNWYASAEVCFAYLADVESDSDLSAPNSPFRTSRWHSRGWTLQELIAPFLVIFVSREWNIIENKRALAPLLENITGVRQQVLTGEMHYSMISVAERMSWASERNTTRVEDEAYSLMGLFDVNMPTIYGEGQQAFQRLQQEIMKQSIDTSLFAWDDWPSSNYAAPVELQEIYGCFDTSINRIFYLLADSPRRFPKPFGLTVRYTPSVPDPLQPYLDWHSKDKIGLEQRARRRFGPFARMELPRFSFTHYGVECRFPVIESDGLTIAVLLCDTGYEHLGLLLFPSRDPVQDPSRKKYHTAYGFRTPGPTHRMRSNAECFRLIPLGDDLHNLTLRLNGNAKKVTAKWRNIFISDSPHPVGKDVAANHRCFPLHSIEPAPPFRLPHWLIGMFTQMGLNLQPLRTWGQHIAGTPLIVSADFMDQTLGSLQAVCLRLGTCVQADRPSKHWAKVLLFCTDNWIDETVYDHTHDCRTHHVAEWPDWTKDFGDAERTVRLSFSRCTLTPEHTLVVHVELKGRVYEDMKTRRRKNESGLDAAHAAEPHTFPPIHPTRTRATKLDMACSIVHLLHKSWVALHPRRAAGR